MHCLIFICLCGAPQYISYGVMDKKSLRNRLRIIGFKFGEVETARQAPSAVKAEKNEGLDKAAALYFRELTLD